jgi:hypothetical protein
VYFVGGVIWGTGVSNYESAGIAPQAAHSTRIGCINEDTFCTLIQGLTTTAVSLSICCASTRDVMEFLQRIYQSTPVGYKAGSLFVDQRNTIRSANVRMVREDSVRYLMRIHTRNGYFANQPPTVYEPNPNVRACDMSETERTSKLFRIRDGAHRLCGTARTKSSQRNFAFWSVMCHSTLMIWRAGLTLWATTLRRKIRLRSGLLG